MVIQETLYFKISYYLIVCLDKRRGEEGMEKLLILRDLPKIRIKKERKYFILFG